MIEILEITDSLITVESGGQEIEVSRARFEAWLKNSDKLSWVKDWRDEKGERGQSAGAFTLEDYYSYEHYLKSDLAEFLTTRQPMTGKIKDLGILFEQLKKSMA